MRGEQVPQRDRHPPGAGSPPLARGTGVGICAKCLRGGITPACAGNSTLLSFRARQNEDHPRLRGEQDFDGPAGVYKVGSPPLARGTVRAGYARAVQHGITPACAGNSPHAQRRPYQCRDHPRLRGEQVANTVAIVIELGSPPLARGTVANRAAEHNINGITPACAGNRNACAAVRL